ncbi:MAG: NUDIX domain-containing protein [Nitriliruptorales bacterium]|nr:NUDIX domain-containing protein [Nitriliruptorales bacterium]
MTPPVSLAVDVVVLTLPASVAELDAWDASEDRAARPAPLFLAGRRDHPPFAGAWSLPGGLVAGAEGLEAAARRVLAEAASRSDAIRLAAPRHLEQLATFGAPTRDPRGRVVSVSYLALLPVPAQVAGNAAWLPADDPPELAFDHRTILSSALNRLRAKLSYSTVAYGLLPDHFTLSELQAVYEAVRGRSLDKRNFRRKVLALGFLEDTGDQRRGSHRPAQLYRFSQAGLVLLDDVITT